MATGAADSPSSGVNSRPDYERDPRASRGTRGSPRCIRPSAARRAGLVSVDPDGGRRIRAQAERPDPRVGSRPDSGNRLTRARSASWKSRARSGRIPPSAGRGRSRGPGRPRSPAGRADSLHAPEKQSRADQEEKAQRDLDQDQARAQARTSRPSRETPPDSDERAREVDPPRLQRRNQPDEERRDEADADRDGEHPPVDRSAQPQRHAERRIHQEEGIAHPVSRARPPATASAARISPSVRSCRPAAAARADRETHRHLVPPRDGFDEQQIPYVPQAIRSTKTATPSAIRSVGSRKLGAVEGRLPDREQPDAAPRFVSG